MEWGSTHILYRSENYLARLYRQVEDTPDEIQMRSGEEFQAGVEGKIGLSDLISSLPGVKLEGKATGQAKSINEEVRIETTDTIDQELAVAERLKASNLPSLDSIDETSVGVPHYFAGSVMLSNNIQEGGVIVKHEADGVTITGSTSEDNWVSRSVLNNLLMSESNQTYGLFVPFDISSQDQGLEVTAQYILILLLENE
ncbi:hypothetical protein [Halorhabdus sp. SVX81]|uniref:hypothetical protein n=1 Tax=Halorhabdus sp. SVX81 TaxID=2978283 RepID=UPI0023D9B34B|nr:hypothetical protein [Halorhabdus sp. SVX81]